MAYNIGLDIGTNSIGWAVLDDNGDLCKFKQRPMHGTIIDFSNTSSKNKNEVRRNFRSQRRRIQRKKQRINWLQSLMTDLVSKEDPYFFRKLKYSFLSPKDSKFDLDNIMHTDRGAYKSVQYKNEYPTIYHLRKALATGGKMDIRLVYLALHHIISNRGNFLYEGQKLSLANFSMEDDIAALFELLSDNIANAEIDVSYIVEVLKEPIRKGDKIDKLKEHLTPLYIPFEEGEPKKAKDDYIKAVIKLILGDVGDFAKIIHKEDKIAFSLSSELNDDTLAKLSDDDMDLVEAFEKVYSGVVILGLLSGEKVNTVSDCYINRFNNHGKDLVTLKKCVRKYCPDSYRSIINAKDITKNSKYTSYFLYMKNSGKYGLMDKPSAYGLYKTIKDKLLKDNILSLGDKDIEYIDTRIKEGSFLLKPRNTDNSAIPYQFNAEELKAILDNQGKYYPELLALKDKIVSIVEFRIPYYVGPLSSSSPHHWVEKNSNEKITPWNFDEVINHDKSEFNFIKRMTGKCTELVNEDVLPRCSPIYQKFSVLNELANIKIDGQRLAPDVRKAAVNTLFLKKERITKKEFKLWLLENSFIPNDDVTITGFSDDKGFTSSLSTIIKFNEILGDNWDLEMGDKIVEMLTVSSSKERVKLFIVNNYKELSYKQADKLSKIKCKGWGRFSKKLLTGLCVATKDKGCLSILELLEETEQNYMEIRFNPEYGFDTMIAEYNLESFDNLSIEEFINKYPISPSARHMTYVAYKAVIDIVKAKKGELPNSIYIETASGDEIKKKGKTTFKRYDSMSKVYEKLKNNDQFDEVYKELKALDPDIKKDFATKYMLYFMQNGKCLYSGKSIGGIQNLSQCQIDHILPQCYVKDNSIDNLALVFASENQRKADTLLLSEEIINARKAEWYVLYKNNLISRKKYNNLIRTEITEDDATAFINRQLVETRQETKLLMNVLRMTGFNQVYGVSAKLTSAIRSRCAINYPSMIKIREVNDFHHADDAYIAAFVGNFVQKKFSPNQRNGIKKFYECLKEDYDTKFDKYGMLTYIFMHDYSFWNGSEEVAKLASNCNMKSYFIRYNTEEASGEFYNQTKMPKGCGTVPLSKDRADISLYGGYTGDQPSYFVIAKKKKKLKLVGIPIRITALGKVAIKEYLEEQGFTLYSNRKILKNQEIKYVESDGRISNYMIVGDGEVINARQLILDEKTLSHISSFFRNKGTEDEVHKHSRIAFDNILKHLSTYPCYEKIYLEFLERREDFLNSNLANQKVVLLNLFKIMHANSARVDSNQWGLKDEKEGIADIKKSSRLVKTLAVENIYIYDKSPTALFCKINPLI